MKSRTSLLEISAGALAAVLLIVLLVQIILRYIGKPFIWVEEFSVTAFIWLMFLGVAIAFRRSDHLVVDLLYSRLQTKLKPRFFALLDFCLHGLILILLLVFCIGLVGMTKQSWSMFAATMPGFRIAYIYIGVLVAALASIMTLVQRCVVLAGQFKMNKQNTMNDQES